MAEVRKKKTPSRPKRKSAMSKPKPNRTRAKVKLMLEQALRQEFPKDTVDISDGYQDNIHVLVVSRKFDELDHQQKQDYLWKIIDSCKLTKQEKLLISLVFPVSPSELK